MNEIEARSSRLLSLRYLRFTRCLFALHKEPPAYIVPQDISAVLALLFLGQRQ